MKTIISICYLLWVSSFFTFFASLPDRDVNLWYPEPISTIVGIGLLLSLGYGAFLAIDYLVHKKS